MTRKLLATSSFLLALTLTSLHAAEYFVALSGNDGNGGRAPRRAFRTIQRGVDALAPGDTLIIAPGEYHESVRRDGLGTNGVTTTIRAELPGTVLLRGDVPISDFTAVEGRRFTYVANVALPGEARAVNELDTLTILTGMPNRAEPEFMPGTFYHDRDAGKLYLSTSDGRPPAEHRYTACVIPNHGFFLSHPTRVVVEGIAATGFFSGQEMPRHDFSLASTWGIFICDGKESMIRNCKAYLNAQGIGLSSHSYHQEAGDNVIEHCEAWANQTQYGVGDRGGLTLVQPCRDVIRDSLAYLNGHYGINIRGKSQDPSQRSLMLRSIAWGNGFCDFKIKSGGVYETVRCAGGRPSNKFRPSHCLLDTGQDYETGDNIFRDREESLVMSDEFADPANNDYRLQATSRFRGTAPDGGDRGPHPYAPNIFYVKPDGNDRADGLSVSNAWRSLAEALGGRPMREGKPFGRSVTLQSHTGAALESHTTAPVPESARATTTLKAGDTLYLLPGVYKGDLNIALDDRGAEPISIRGRGTEPAVIQGTVRVAGNGRADFHRLAFQGVVTVAAGTADLMFSHCRFAATNTCIRATGLQGLRIEHCAFSNFTHAALDLTDCANVDLRGNWFDNARGPAIRVNTADAIRYAGYNGYRTPDGAGEPAMDNLPPTTHHLPPLSATVGPFNKPLGPYRDAPREATPRLLFGPVVHSLSATTANLEWRTSRAAGCQLAWGDTPQCTNTTWLDVNYFGTYSLTGLEPGKTYYFSVKALRGPSSFRQTIGMEETPEIVAHLDQRPIAFTTAKRDPAPSVYHVASDGLDSRSGLSRDQAWRTIQHAADRIKPGDTVRIGAGHYRERVMIRASGETNAPITFRSAPGEKVVMDGDNKSLNAAFVATGKRHLRFDALTFQDSNREVLGGWFPEVCGEFRLYRCKDIQITRCLSDGRDGYTARTLSAMETEDLLVRNCVTINKMSGAMAFFRCPNVRLEHNVFVRPMISSFSLNNTAVQPVVLDSNIFTDMLAKKAKLNISFAEVEAVEALRLTNNCFLIREFPPEERIIFSDVDHAERKVTATFTMEQFDRQIAPADTLFANPRFAGDPDPDGEGFPPDRLARPGTPLNLNDFFATHPEVVERRIGLEKDACSGSRPVTAR